MSFGFFNKTNTFVKGCRLVLNINYLKPTEACQTKANAKNNTGIAGITSTIGRNAVNGSGKADSKNIISIIYINLSSIKKTLSTLYSNFFKECVKN